MQKEQEDLAREKQLTSLMEKREQEAVREEVAKNLEMIKEERQRLKEQERRRQLGQEEGKAEGAQGNEDVLPGPPTTSTTRRATRSSSASVSESGGSDQVLACNRSCVPLRWDRPSFSFITRTVSSSLASSSSSSL